MACKGDRVAGERSAVRINKYFTEQGFCSRRAARSLGSVPPVPNSRSNTTCGSSSIGRGCVGDDHEMVFEYVQLYPSPQLLEFAPGSSSASCSDGSSESCPILLAMI